MDIVLIKLHRILHQGNNLEVIKIIVLYNIILTPATAALKYGEYKEGTQPNVIQYNST